MPAPTRRGDLCARTRAPRKAIQIAAHLRSRSARAALTFDPSGEIYPRHLVIEYVDGDGFRLWTWRMIRQMAVQLARITAQTSRN
jgi:hypothetical protein